MAKRPDVKLSILLAGIALLLALSIPRLLRRLIRVRLGGYIRTEIEPDDRLPERVQSERSVAVIGSGVAGLTAATVLSRRGYRVTLLEKNDYLGGKLGSWPVELEPGRVVPVSHGFHAFFPHYYNLNRFLDGLGLRESFVSIGDYVIVGKNAETLRFQNLSTTPVFNLLSLMRAGMFSFSDAVRAPGRDLYGVFLEYEQEQTFRQFDSLSYADFSKGAKVPPRLKLAFNTFARAFFAEEDRLSFAELVKAFHFYYLSQDGGLVYDFPTTDYEEAFLSPIASELSKHGASIETGRTVGQLTRQGDGFSIDGHPFDNVIVATDVVGAKKLLSSAEMLSDDARERFQELTPGQRYAVY